MPASRDLAKQIVEVIIANEVRQDCYVRAQVFVDDWGDMTATGPTGSSVICRKRPRQAAVDEGKHFVTSSWRRIDDDTSPPRIKATGNYLNSRLAGLEARRQGAGGAILLNRDGSVSEGPSGCVFIVRNGVLITTPVTAGILESVTRATLLELAASGGIPVEVRTLDRTEFYLAEEAFYCGTGQEMVPILSLDGKAIGTAEPGPLTRQLQTTYDAVVHGSDEGYEQWLTPVL